MRQATGVALLLLAALTPLQGQSRFRAGFGAGAGLAEPIGDSRSSYGSGPAGKGELTFGLAGSPWSLRLETWYIRLHGAGPPELNFPALNLLAFSVCGVRRIGAAGRLASAYLYAGAGAVNLEDALPFAAWRTSLGLEGGAGLELGRSRLRAFFEGRLVHVTSDPTTDLAAVAGGVRWGL
ncbi:MAG TPA: hypothetical protein VI297_03340 [Gemmatimonadales bacterium]